MWMQKRCAAVHMSEMESKHVRLDRWITDQHASHFGLWFSDVTLVPTYDWMLVNSRTFQWYRVTSDSLFYFLPRRKFSQSGLWPSWPVSRAIPASIHPIPSHHRVQNYACIYIRHKFNKLDIKSAFALSVIWKTDWPPLGINIQIPWICLLGCGSALYISWEACILAHGWRCQNDSTLHHIQYN